MEENKKMKCPFRKDKDGEFKDCYGEKCMAYCDIKPYYISHVPTETDPEKIHCCKMMAINPITSYSCA